MLKGEAFRPLGEQALKLRVEVGNGGSLHVWSFWLLSSLGQYKTYSALSAATRRSGLTCSRLQLQELASGYADSSRSTGRGSWLGTPRMKPWMPCATKGPWLISLDYRHYLLCLDALSDDEGPSFRGEDDDCQEHAAAGAAFEGADEDGVVDLSRSRP